MDIGNFYSTGNSIADLRNASKAAAETKFNELIDEINTTEQDQNSLYGSIQKAGASVTAVGALGKGALKNWQKFKILKAQLQGRRAPPSSPRTADDELIEGGAEGGEGGESAPTARGGGGAEGKEGEGGEGGEVDEDLYEPWMRLPEDPVTGQIDLTGFNFGKDVPDPDLDLNKVYSSTELDSMYGGKNLPSIDFNADDSLKNLQQLKDVGWIKDEGTAVEESVEEGASNIFQQGLSAVKTLGSNISRFAQGVGQDISNMASKVGSAIKSITSKGSQIIEDAATGIDEAATAATTATETGIGTALEAGGDALDATGVGAPIGAILNVLGGLVLGTSMGAGIIGEITSNNEQQENTAQAQEQLKLQTSSGISTIAGRYAV